MRHIVLAFTASLTLTGMAWAQSMAVAAAEAGDAEMEIVDPLEPRDARELTLEEFQWIARPIIVFADTPNDPRVAEQLQLLADRPQPLLDRDVVILVDTDPEARSAIRTALRPRGFSLVVIQKDGAIGFRRPSPRDVREITRGIDNFALRQEEIRTGQ
ncbi:DUF4174 domain-containing protein [Roseicyclus mahoneyensis]|uniref:Uncharacterized protein DUF4174 n=1 Tax=Roseicyclus mahoneyensis TaxID=164332 RepID=A0A316GJM5_9RHOB|nr:DUF4174 domain-containing protein [Roseicyclus mahoneyensis]PWK60981.1 uncharacterized protein DUF4174 [Roseicyclus mahoneyensis]